MLCPLGKRVAGTQLSEQKKTRPVSSTSKHEVKSTFHYWAEQNSAMPPSDPKNKKMHKQYSAVA